MEESEAKDILLALVEPNRNSAIDNIPADVRGWRFPSAKSSNGDVDGDDEYEQPVCFWTGVSCDPVDGTITGLNLGNGFYVETLLVRPAPSPEGVEEGGKGHSRALSRRGNREYALTKKRSHAPFSATRRTDEDVSQVPFISPSFPSSLGRLPSLRFVNLSSNQLQGPIPISVLHLPNLEIFDVSSNDLEGTFPHFKSDSLRVLDLSQNRFHGALDKDLFGHPAVGPNTAPYLVSLVKFDVSRNGFNGTIPLDGKSGLYDSVQRRDPTFANLQYFDLGYNLFSGTICNNFGMLGNLRGLFLEHNRLVGTIPKSLFRGSGIGSNPLPLEQLFLEQNSLSGTLDEGLSSLLNLRELYVDGNKLTGEVPRSLCNMELNGAFLNDTEATRLCDGICCPANSVSREGVAPCTPCPNDGGFHRYIGQHNTKCRGGMSESQILDLFFERTHGNEWSNTTYRWEKGSPACERRGIECNKAGQVTKIVLPSLGLRGVLPPEVGLLRKLRVLALPDNQLTGFLPSDLRFAPLKWLDVSGSQMQGVVPPLLCIKEGINMNGMGGSGVDFDLLYSCDNIACPRGTFSEIGRAALPENDGEDGIQCQPCYDDEAHLYIGRDRCTDLSIAGLQIRTDSIRRVVIKSMPLTTALAIMAIVAYIVPWWRKSAVLKSDNANIDEVRIQSSVHSTRHVDNENEDLPPRQSLLAALTELSSPPDEGDYSDDDWTAAYSEVEGEMNVELSQRSSRLSGVIL